jgi:hypothetical protein
MSRTDKWTGLVTVLLVAGGLAVAGLGLGAGTATADTGGLGGILGSGGSGDGALSGGGGSGDILSKIDELQPVIDAVRADPRGMLNAALDNPGDLIGLLGG